MFRDQNRFPLLVALLLVSSAVLFAVGTAIEHSQRDTHHNETAIPLTAESGGETAGEKKAKGETTEKATTGEATEKKATAAPAQKKTTSETATEKKAKGETTAAGEATHKESATSLAAETHSEKIIGIDPESWPLVGFAIAFSLLVAAGVYWRQGRWLIAAAAFALVFAAADTRELVHQIQESRTTVAVIAAILIALHVLAAIAAGAGFRGSAARRSVA